MTRADEEPGARRCVLTVPSAPAFLPMVQGFVREYAREAGFSPAELDRLDLLVEEAATNVIQGAFDRDENGSFDVVCERVPAGIQITVHDDGRPYDPSLTPDYDPGAALEEPDRRRSGELPDAAARRRGRVPQPRSRGKETVFVKYLRGDGHRSPAGRALPRGAGARAGSGARRDRARPAAQEQAVEVSRCIYDAYRYTYVNE